MSPAQQIALRRLAGEPLEAEPPTNRRTWAALHRAGYATRDDGSGSLTFKGVQAVERMWQRIERWR